MTKKENEVTTVTTERPVVTPGPVRVAEPETPLYKNEPQGTNPAQAAADGLVSGAFKDSDAFRKYTDYSALANDALGKAQEMGSFSYDFNRDPIFKVLSASYMQQARDAANNASALAAARTGGYGNSYGAAAAGQQYNNALSSLYDQVPELQNAAYNRWQNERSDLYNRASLYNNLAENEYNRAWNEDQRSYERQWNEDERSYNREQDEWTRKYNEAKAAADLGNYKPMEELFGIDLSQASEDDAANRFLSLMSLVGEDNIPTMLQQLVAAKTAEGGDGSITGSKFFDDLLTQMYGNNGLGINQPGVIQPQNSSNYQDYGNYMSIVKSNPEWFSGNRPEQTEQPEQEETPRSGGGNGGGGNGGGNGNGGGGNYGGGYSGTKVTEPKTVTIKETYIPDEFINSFAKLYGL